jgi:hypothetical protein
MTMTKHRIPKPFSELSKAQKIIEARAAIARLSHPHNYGSRECQAAIQRWRETLKNLGETH